MAQKVKVDLNGRAYTYLWEGEDDLAPGDWVWLPPNRLHPRPFVAAVIRTDSDYEGELVSILSKYDRRATAIDTGPHPHFDPQDLI